MKRCKTLIVEDEQIIAKDFKARLEHLGCQVVGIADNGIDALNYVASNEIDLIFMDIQIKGDSNGIVTAEKIGEKYDIPIIFTTAFSDDETIRAACKVKPIGYILKPYDTNQLNVAIELALHKRALALAQLDYAQLIESLDCIIWQAHLQDFHFTFVSQQAVRILGYPIQDWLAKPGFLLNHVHIEDKELVTRHFKDSATKGESSHLEFRVIASDSRIVWLHSQISLPNDNSTPHILRGFMRDVTALKNVEKQSQQQASRMQLIIDSALDGVIVLDEQGVVLTYNKAAEQILGYSAEEIVGTQMEKILPPEHRHTHPTYLKNYIAGGPSKIIGIGREVVGIHKDGHRIPLFLNITEARLGDRRIFSGLLRNLTDEKKVAQDHKLLEEKLFLSQKLETLGLLTNGIVNDFNNILVSIIGYADVAQRMHAEDPHFQHVIQQINQSGIRAQELVNQITSFSRQSPDKLMALDLLSALSALEKLLKSTLPSKIELIIRHKPGPYIVWGNSAQLQHALMNLCNYAIRCMPQGGSLQIELESIVLKSYLAALKLPAGMYHLLRIKDCGVGLSADDLKKIFDPNFSSQPTGTSGLELFVAREIINHHKGGIRADSIPGQGTEFFIYLPLSLQSIKLEQPDDPTPISGSGRVLLVDDEETVVELVQAFLENIGFTVEAFTNSEKAIEAFKAAPDSYSWVLSDLSMPKFDGVSLYAILKMIRPKIEIIIMSGNVDTSLRARMNILNIEHKIDKPFISKELIKKLTEIGLLKT